ncbi:MAG: type VI secretion protein IcmF/TssM N-terminal domain-containing protein [Phycisphaerales bacterium]|nr:hypothetical protein [Planctomycetota bacterium]
MNSLLLGMCVSGVGATRLFAAGDYSALLKLIPRDGTFLAVLGAGAVVVALLIGVFQWFIQVRDKAKGAPFADLIKNAAGMAPVIADPAQRARLDDLRRKFDDGVEKFRAAGKDLYSLPWYLLVGPAGSGKTEALRHCNVGFPPGLQDYLQGAGGTLNMHWWFTNHAVVLDTAGRMFMEAAGTADGGDGGEWAEFLRLLKRSRPNEPVNGMFLVIGADSLIRDKAEEIESKAGRIAQQLDTIQRTLDVRFPVFVIITKCDLIAGFREFFDNIHDPNLQHQLLGWSNPDNLDAPLRIELVEEHMRQVKQRLLARRLALVADTTKYAQGTGKRIDEVDELYALPENLEKVVPRLRRYLETIFAGGEWSPKPLFLRGIYFTSSMREGEALDQDLAKALGLTLDSLPGGKIWEKERSFFLRDVFLSKAFREKGLVTRATNVRQEQNRRRLALLGSAVAAAVAVLGFAIYGQSQLGRSIEGPRDFWKSVGVAMGVLQAEKPEGDTQAAPTGTALTRGDTAIVRYEAPNWVYLGDRSDIGLPDSVAPRAKLPELATQRASEPVKVPVVFSPAAVVVGAGGGFKQEQQQASAAVLEKSVLIPLVEGARQRLREDKAWDSRATAALAELLRLETLKLNLAPAGGPRANLIDLKALFSYVLGGKPAPEDLSKWQDAVESTYGLGAAPSSGKLPWPPASLKVGDVASVRSIGEGLQRFAGAWGERARGDEFAMGKLSLVAESLAQFRSEEAKLMSLRGMPDADANPTPLVQTNAELESFSSQARSRIDGMAAAAGKCDALLAELKLAPSELSGAIGRTKREALDQINGEYALLLSQLPTQGEGDSTEPPPIDDIRRQIAARRENAEKLVDGAAQKIDAALASVMPLAAPGPGGRESELAYRVHLDAYKRGAQDLFDRQSASGDADWYGLSDRFRRLDTTLERASADIDSIVRGLADAQARKLVGGAAKALARTGRAAGATEVLSGFLAKLPDTAEGVLKAVESIARVKGVRPYTKPTVPLTDLKGGEIPVPYSPAAAGIVLGGLTRAESELSSGGAVIDKDRLLAEVRARGKGLDEYARSYAGVWASGLVREMSLSESLKSWDSLGPAMTGGLDRAADSGPALRQLASAAVDAVEPLPASVKNLPEVKSAIEKLRASIEQLSDESAVRRRGDAMKNLAPLGALDWQTARAALLAPGAGQSKVESLAVLGCAKPHDVLGESIAVGVLRALRAKYEPSAREALDVLRASDKWPLSRTGDVAKPLDETALLRALAAAELLSAPPAGTVELTGEVQALFGDLRGRQVLTDAQRQRVEKVRTVAAALANGLDQKQPVIVSMVPVWSRRDAEALPPLSSLNIGSSGDAVEWFEQMDVVRDGEAAGPRIGLRGLDAARASELVKQLSITSPGPGVTFRFYRNIGDSAPAGEARIPGPWTAAVVALFPGAHAAAPGGNAWVVPLPVLEPASKQTFHLWMNVTFSSAMPPAGDWPGATSWPK